MRAHGVRSVTRGTLCVARLAAWRMVYDSPMICAAWQSAMVMRVGGGAHLEDDGSEHGALDAPEDHLDLQDFLQKRERA
jgi:hypothetical protein